MIESINTPASPLAMSSLERKDHPLFLLRKRMKANKYTVPGCELTSTDDELEREESLREIVSLSRPGDESFFTHPIKRRHIQLTPPPTPGKPRLTSWEVGIEIPPFLPINTKSDHVGKGREDNTSVVDESSTVSDDDSKKKHFKTDTLIQNQKINICLIPRPINIRNWPEDMCSLRKEPRLPCIPSVTPDRMEESSQGTPVKPLDTANGKELATGLSAMNLGPSTEKTPPYQSQKRAGFSARSA